MGVVQTTALRRCSNPVRVWCAGLVAGLILLISGAGALAATSQVAIVLRPEAARPLIVRNDRGGLVGARAEEIIRLRKSGRRVELRGRVCLSSCTMYLGVPNLCVSVGTTFGFHGPSYYGQPLSARDFEYWSQLIAAHYPDALKRWYLAKGRHRKSGYYQVKGSALIAMGVPRCP